MKKLILFFSVTLITTLLNTVSAQGMEIEKDSQSTHCCVLIELPSEILASLTKGLSLTESIKIFMRLSRTCVYFNDLLTPDTIGNYCKHYARHDKMAIFEDLVTKQFDNKTILKKLTRYPALKIPMLIIAHAGINLAKTWLLQEAASISNKELVAMVFEHEANPNEIVNHKGYKYPAFFLAKTPEIAQTFAEYKVDLTQYDANKYNVLWYIGNSNSYSLEMIEFYIKHGVNARELCPHSGNCLLHQLVENQCIGGQDDLHLKKVKFLIDAIPDMINTYNKAGETPTDVAEKNHHTKAFATLLKDHGGRTAKEYEQKITSIKQRRQEDETRFDCIIC